MRSECHAREGLAQDVECGGELGPSMTRTHVSYCNDKTAVLILLTFLWSTVHGATSCPTRISNNGPICATNIRPSCDPHHNSHQHTPHATRSHPSVSNTHPSFQHQLSVLSPLALAALPTAPTHRRIRPDPLSLTRTAQARRRPRLGGLHRAGGNDSAGWVSDQGGVWGTGGGGKLGEKRG